MTIQWWQEQEGQLSQKVIQHKCDVIHAASQLQKQIQGQASAGISDFQKEYWKQDLELRKKQHALMEKNQKHSEEMRKLKPTHLLKASMMRFLLIALILRIP